MSTLTKKEILKIYRKQTLRQAKYPVDRIAFLKSWNTAQQDTDSIKKYEAGKESLEWLCSQIARHNYLDQYFIDGKIPEEMMLNELRIIGRIEA